jgi:hypothetical protein
MYFCLPYFELPSAPATLFQNMQGICNQHRVDGRAADGDQLGRFHQYPQVAVLHQIAGHHRAEHHHDSNNYEHRTPGLSSVPANSHALNSRPATSR